MTFGRWLLVNSLSISIFAMVAVGYFFKDELKLNEAYSQLLSIEKPLIEISKSPKQNPINVTKSTIDLAPEDVQEVASTESVASIQKEPKKSITTQNFDHSRSQIIDTTPDAETTLSVIKEEPVDYLLKAREAFWNNNFKVAIELYNDEIKKQPNSPDLYGEVGNIYYGLDNYVVASDYYFKAGKLFLKANDQFRAKQIYDILSSIAPSKAEQLAEIKNTIQP